MFLLRRHWHSASETLCAADTMQELIDHVISNDAQHFVERVLQETFDAKLIKVDRCEMGCTISYKAYAQWQIHSIFMLSDRPIRSISEEVAAALRLFVGPGEKVIWRMPFRWFDDEGVLSNHYDGMELETLAEAFDYEIVFNARDAAIIRKK